MNPSENNLNNKVDNQGVQANPLSASGNPQPQPAAPTPGPSPAPAETLMPITEAQPSSPAAAQQPTTGPTPPTPPQSNVMRPSPGSAPALTGGNFDNGGNMPNQYNPPQPKSGKSKKIIIIVASLLLIAGIAAVLFYFLYWTRSDVVYARFQRQISKIVSETLNTDIKLLNDVSYSLEVSSQGTDLPIKAVANGRLVKSGSENSADITYANATINLAANTVNNSNNFDLFVKYKGITQFYNSLASNSSTKELASSTSSLLPVLKKYDDKWISVNLFGAATGNSADQNEQITQADYKAVKDKLLPIFQDRFIGLKKADAVIITSNPKTENFSGKSAWVYQLAIDNAKYNAMIEAMISATDTASISDTKKAAIKDTLESQKSPVAQATSQDELTVYKIWLEKITGLPLKLSIRSESKYNGELLGSDEFITEITSISAKSIIAKLTNTSSNYRKGALVSSSVLSSNINLDNSTTKISIDGTYDPNSTKQNDVVSAKFQLSVATNKAAVTKPNSYVTLEQVLQDLGLSDTLGVNSRSGNFTALESLAGSATKAIFVQSGNTR